MKKNIIIFYVLLEKTAIHDRSEPILIAGVSPIYYTVIYIIATLLQKSRSLFKERPSKCPKNCAPR